MIQDIVFPIASVALTIATTFAVLKEEVVAREYTRRNDLYSAGATNVDPSIQKVREDLFWWPLPPGSKR